MTSAADAYARHVGRYGAQLAAGLIEAAGVARGQRVLDVGCGPGALTEALAGVTEHVAAVEPFEEYVEACRQRVPGADVRVAAAEELPIDEVHRVGHASAGELAALWHAAGLADVVTGSFAVEADYDDFDDLFSPFTEGANLSVRTYQSLDPADQQRVREDAFLRLGSPTGGFTLTARAWWVRGS